MKIRNRLTQYIEQKGISKNQFAKEIGTSSAMISKITTTDINFGIDIIQKIVRRYPDLNIAWLVTGIGNMSTCQRCGISLPKGNNWKYCTHCGTPLL